MDEKCYKAVISEMQVLLDGQKFVAKDDIFVNDQKAVKVWYEENTKCFKLSVAPVISEEVGDFTEIAGWLFDESQTEKDALAVGVDFADTLRQNLGLKKSTVRGAAQVTLPVAEKGDDVTVLTLTQKLLAVFPEKKEIYKESVAKHGKYLYLDFIMTEFVPLIKNMLANEIANKKQIKKLFDMLSDTYVDGDKAATDMVVAVICAIGYENENNTAIITKNIEGNSHLKMSVNQFSAELKHNKKLRKALKIEE